MGEVSIIKEVESMEARLDEVPIKVGETHQLTCSTIAKDGKGDCICVAKGIFVIVPITEMQLNDVAQVKITSIKKNHKGKYFAFGKKVV